MPYELECKCHNGHDNYSYSKLDPQTLISWKVDNIIPFLRPLSDLIKEIEHNGERFSPEYTIWKLSQDKQFIIEISQITGLSIETPYWAIQMLISWHFDVFGLIEKGLAIKKD